MPRLVLDQSNDPLTQSNFFFFFTQSNFNLMCIATTLDLLKTISVSVNAYF